MSVSLIETEFVYAFHYWVLTFHEANESASALHLRHLGEAPGNYSEPYWAVYQLNLFNNEDAYR